MNIFFDINKMIYKYEKDGTLKKVEHNSECLDGICLTANVNSSIDKKYIYTNVFDVKTKIELIRKELKYELGDYVFSNFIEGKNNFVFALEKKYFLNLMDDYGFKKVYPLEFFLYKLGSGRNGIVSDQLMLLKKYENEMDFKTNYLGNQSSETIYYINLPIDIYIQTLQRVSDDSIDINIAIFSKEVAKEINSFNRVDIDQFNKFIKLYDNFCIKDKISQRYRKQVLHRYLYLGDVALIGLISIAAFFYLKSSSEYLYYSSEVESQGQQISKFDKLNKDILAQLPKMEFNKFPLKEAREVLVPLTHYDPTKTLYTFNIPKNEILVEMTVNGIANVEKLVSYLKDNNYENSYIKKEGYNFDFKIKVKINKEKESANKKRGR